MPVTLTSYPMPVLWSKNQSRFTFTYSAVSTSWKLEVRVVDANSNAVLFTSLYPFRAASGTINIDLEDVFDKLYIPLSRPTIVSGLDTVELQNHKRSVKVQYRFANTGTTNTWTDAPNNFNVVKGGYGKLDFVSEFDINNSSLTFDATKFYPQGTHQFLTIIGEKKIMTPYQYAWLLYFSTNNTSQRVEYSVFYMDGTLSTFTQNMPFTNLLYRSFYIPIGINQLGVDPTNKGVRMMDIKIKRQTSPFTQLTKYRVLIDNRPAFKPITVYFRNSIGGIEDLTFTGYNEMVLQNEKKEFYTDRILATNGTNPYFESKVKPTIKVNTSHLTQEQLVLLAELTQSVEVFMIKDTSMIPLKLLTKSVNLWNNDNLLNANPLEFEIAGDFKYLPKDLY